MVRCLRMSVAALLAASIASGCAASRSMHSSSTTLSSTTNIDLGSPNSGFGTEAIFQAPNDVVYYAVGRTINVVRGGARPAHLATMPSSVWALAATNANLFVETALSVTEISLPSGSTAGTWPLPEAMREEGPNGPIMSVAGWEQSGWGGLSLQGEELWAWEDSYCDPCGLEGAGLARFSLTTMRPTLVDIADLMPYATVAGALGFYYPDVYSRIVRADSSKRLTRSAPVATGPEAFAIEGKTLYFVASAGQSLTQSSLYRYNASTLKPEGSVRLAFETESLISTHYGLMAVVAPGAKSYAIALVNPATGAETTKFKIQDYSGEDYLQLLYGSHLSAIITRGNKVYLDRLDIR
jgi:hypothetical protein